MKLWMQSLPKDAEEERIRRPRSQSHRSVAGIARPRSALVSRARAVIRWHPGLRVGKRCLAALEVIREID